MYFRKGIPENNDGKYVFKRLQIRPYVFDWAKFRSRKNILPIVLVRNAFPEIYNVAPRYC